MPSSDDVQPRNRKLPRGQLRGGMPVVKFSLIVMFALSLATLSLAASAIPAQSAPAAIELR